MRIMNHDSFKQCGTYPQSNLKKMKAKDYKICDHCHCIPSVIKTENKS